MVVRWNESNATSFPFGLALPLSYLPQTIEVMDYIVLNDKSTRNQVEHRFFSSCGTCVVPSNLVIGVRVDVLEDSEMLSIQCFVHSISPWFFFLRSVIKPTHDVLSYTLPKEFIYQVENCNCPYCDSYACTPQYCHLVLLFIGTIEVPRLAVAVEAISHPQNCCIKKSSMYWLVTAMTHVDGSIWVRIWHDFLYMLWSASNASDEWPGNFGIASLFFSQTELHVPPSCQPPK